MIFEYRFLFADIDGVDTSLGALSIIALLLPRRLLVKKLFKWGTGEAHALSPLQGWSRFSTTGHHLINAFCCKLDPKSGRCFCLSYAPILRCAVDEHQTMNLVTTVPQFCYYGNPWVTMVRVLTSLLASFERSVVILIIFGVQGKHMACCQNSYRETGFSVLIRPLSALVIFWSLNGGNNVSDFGHSSLTFHSNRLWMHGLPSCVAYCFYL